MVVLPSRRRLEGVVLANELIDEVFSVHMIRKTLRVKEVEPRPRLLFSSAL